jgi:hypothetical protein
MESSSRPTRSHSSGWYLVCLYSGSTAVVSSEDLSRLIETGSLLTAVFVSDEMGRKFEQARARAAYMSANHRIKAGESGGVG